jgi:hypothetical protein
MDNFKGHGPLCIVCVVWRDPQINTSITKDSFDSEDSRPVEI